MIPFVQLENMRPNKTIFIGASEICLTWDIRVFFIIILLNLVMHN